MGETRVAARARVTADILAAARREIAERGGGGLSMRAIARSVGLVSSAIYRYFPTREALLTAMIVESYTNLDAALARADQGCDRAWVGLGQALREWALASPQEFQLIYGTPVPGYFAPAETIPAAAAVADRFLRVGATHTVEAYDEPGIVAQMTSLVADRSGYSGSGAAATVAELAALVGFVGLELSGHFVGTAEPAGRIYAALLNRQVVSLGLSIGH